MQKIVTINFEDLLNSDKVTKKKQRRPVLAIRKAAAGAHLHLPPRRQRLKMPCRIEAAQPPLIKAYNLRLNTTFINVFSVTSGAADTSL